MPYTVQIFPTHHSFSIEEDQTILDAALAHGHPFPYGCRGGMCGACRAKLVKGEITYDNPDIPGLEQLDTENGELLTCQAKACSDIQLQVHEIEQAKDIEVKTLPCQIVKMEKVSYDVMLLWLKLPKDERLQFLAGQYVNFILRDGRRRSFSIANAPSHDELLELHVRHVPGGYFTTYVFEKMEEGSLLRIEAPLGSFFLRHESTQPIIFIAGGTGFAPIKGMIEQAIVENSQRPIHLYWGVRSKADLYMHELVQNWAEKHAHIHYIPVLSDPKAEDSWQGRTGFVHEAVLEDIADPQNYEVYASGPPPMIQAAGNTLTQKGLPESQFFFDSFEYASQ